MAWRRTPPRSRARCRCPFARWRRPRGGSRRRPRGGSRSGASGVRAATRRRSGRRAGGQVLAPESGPPSDCLQARRPSDRDERPCHGVGEPDSERAEGERSRDQQQPGAERHLDGGATSRQPAAGRAGPARGDRSEEIGAGDRSRRSRGHDEGEPHKPRDVNGEALRDARGNAADPAGVAVAAQDLRGGTLPGLVVTRRSSPPGHPRRQQDRSHGCARRGSRGP